MTNLINWLSSPSALQEINREKARRKASRSLLDFTKFTYGSYKADPAHELVAATLDRVVSGQLTRLMIFMPPQHGKSELVSVRLPAYWLGKRPNDPVILTSYAASLAVDKSKQARAVVESPEYREVFPRIATYQGSRASEHWRVDDPEGKARYQGYMHAAGVAGPITGHGAMLGIIDDPYEGWVQAQSEAVRKSVEAWYRGTFLTRFWEGAALILILTRWHEADLAGYLMEEDAGEWEVLRLPAISEGEGDPLGRAEGEPLCPSRYSLPTLLKLKKAVGPWVWQAEYQGSPTQDSGDIFKADWFRRYDPTSPPAMGYTIQSWDTAFKETAAAAFSAATTWGHGRQGAVLRDAWRARLDWPGLVLAIGLYYVVATPRPRKVLIEDKASGQSAIQQWRTGKRREDLVLECRAYLERADANPALVRLIERFFEVLPRVRPVIHVPVVPWEIGSGGKRAQADEAAVWYQAGQVWHPIKASWLEEYEREFTQFPNGKFSDWVDCSSQGVLSLLGVVGAGSASVQEL